MSRLGADLLLLAAAAVWGLAFVFQKSAMATVGPLTFIAARAIVAAVALVPLAAMEYAWRRRAAATPAAWPTGLARSGVAAGLAFTAAAAFQQFGLQTATASNGGFLTALYVVLTPPMAWLLRRARPGRTLIPAVAFSAVGTWMLSGGTFAALTGGDWLVAACAVFWALHVILTENGAGFDRPIQFTCVQFATVAVAAAIGAALFETPSIAGLLAASNAILYVGLLSSALTFTILTWALKYAPATEAAVIISTESLFAALAGAALLDERLPPIAWAGASLIMAAVVLVQVGPRAGKVTAE